MAHSEGEVTTEMAIAGRDVLRGAMPGDAPTALATAVYLAMLRARPKDGFREWYADQRAKREEEQAACLGGGLHPTIGSPLPGIVSCGIEGFEFDQPVVREMLDGSTFVEYPPEPDFPTNDDLGIATPRRQRDEDVRMECVRMAQAAHGSYTIRQQSTGQWECPNPLDLAREIYAWVKGADDPAELNDRLKARVAVAFDHA